MSALQTTGQAPELLRLSPTTFKAGFPDRASSDTPVQSDSWQRPARHPRGGLSQPALPALHPLWPQVHEDYDCTLNQTNIGNNNNKFYIIQLLEEGDCFFCWNRWGRVVSATHPSCAHLLPTSPCSVHACCPQGSPQLTQAERPQPLTVALPHL